MNKIKTSTEVQNPHLVTSKKRYAFIPLEEGRRDAALNGEILVSRNTGHFYVKDDYGNIISATLKVEEKLNEIIDNSYFEQVDENYNTIRKAYRFYFDTTDKLRLDRDLKLPNGAYWFNVKDVNDESKFYLEKASVVGKDATYVGNLLNNTNYWVIFYNKLGDPITQYLFTAKCSDSIISDLIPADKLLDKIQIEVANDIITVGDSWLDVCPRVYAYYQDHSRRDITEDSGLILHKPDISTTGTKSIKASFFSMTDSRFAYATYDIEVIEEPVSEINTISVYPHVIVMKNGVKNIKLSIIGHFSNGTTQDITNKCVVTDFDNTLFNKAQTITITTTYGKESVYEFEHTLKVDMNEEPKKVFFNNEILVVESSLDYLPYPYYRVRQADDLETYNTLQYVTTGYEHAYVGSLRTNDALIIEYYTEEKEIVHSVYATAEFRLTIPSKAFRDPNEILDF